MNAIISLFFKPLLVAQNRMWHIVGVQKYLLNEWKAELLSTLFLSN